MMRRILHTLSARLGRGAGCEVWVAAGPGAPLFAEAAGLTRQEAFSTAARCRHAWPGAAVLVCDATGTILQRT